MLSVLNSKRSILPFPVPARPPPAASCNGSTAGAANPRRSATKAVAGMQKKQLPADFSVTVTVPLILGDDGGYSIEADLKVKLPGWERADAEALAVAAHKVCPYSKATRNNIPVKVSVA